MRNSIIVLIYTFLNILVQQNEYDDKVVINDDCCITEMNT